MSKKSQRQDGFTIIELMIATAVLSVILLLVTIMMIGIGKLYYKGVNQARVQDAVRSITDEVSEHLQDTDVSPTSAVSGDGSYQARCIGTTRYTWIINVQIGKSATYKHILWRDTVAAGSCSVAVLTDPNPSGAGSYGTELITPNSRLTAFSVSPTSPYTVSVAIAYGDDDLLNLVDLTNVTCKGGIGDQFCATASLTTTVAQRLRSGVE